MSAARILLAAMTALLCGLASAQTPETRTGAVVVGRPTGDNKGAGSINAQSIYINGAAIDPVYCNYNGTSYGWVYH
jgi:hypothetical protein